MTDKPKLWRDMTDAEKGALLLAKHESKTIEWNGRRVTTGTWGTWDGWSKCDNDCLWDGKNIGEGFAYRVKPVPVVETVEHRCHVFAFSGVRKKGFEGHDYAPGCLGNITHTYTITNGRVTACKTVIHD